MKKRVFSPLLLVLFSTVFFISCSSDSDEDNTTELVFSGSWSGTFSGGDSGTWTGNVDGEGSLSGNAFSNNLQQSLPFNGTVDNSGSFRATAGTAENGATFEGTFTKSSSSGTWENNAAQISGAWEGAKN